jgi:hypothetical protein
LVVFYYFSEAEHDGRGSVAPRTPGTRKHQAKMLWKHVTAKDSWDFGAASLSLNENCDLSTAEELVGTEVDNDNDNRQTDQPADEAEFQ